MSKNTNLSKEALEEQIQSLKKEKARLSKEHKEDLENPQIIKELDEVEKQIENLNLKLDLENKPLVDELLPKFKKDLNTLYLEKQSIPITLKEKELMKDFIKSHISVLKDYLEKKEKFSKFKTQVETLLKSSLENDQAYNAKFYEKGLNHRENFVFKAGGSNYIDYDYLGKQIQYDLNIELLSFMRQRKELDNEKFNSLIADFISTKLKEARKYKNKLVKSYNEEYLKSFDEIKEAMKDLKEVKYNDFLLKADGLSNLVKQRGEIIKENLDLANHYLSELKYQNELQKQSKDEILTFSNQLKNQEKPSKLDEAMEELEKIREENHKERNLSESQNLTQVNANDSSALDEFRKEYQESQKQEESERENNSSTRGYRR